MGEIHKKRNVAWGRSGHEHLLEHENICGVRIGGLHANCCVYDYNPEGDSDVVKLVGVDPLHDNDDDLDAEGDPLQEVVLWHEIDELFIRIGGR